MANYHPVILKKPYLEAILVGRKTIESRLFKTKHSPFGRVRAGDTLFLKQSSGPVCAIARASAVKNFENLTPEQIIRLKERYNGQIKGSDEYWQSKLESKFAFLVWLVKVENIEPVRVNKKDWRAWVILTQQQNFNLLSPNCSDAAESIEPVRSNKKNGGHRLF